MNSKSKTLLTQKEIVTLLKKAGIDSVTEISHLCDGEFNAVYSGMSQNKEYALKMAPKKNVPVLTYEKNMIQSEVYWYNQIRQHTLIHVPEIFHLELVEDAHPAPWFLMEKLEGEAMDHFAFHNDEEKRSAEKELVRMIASIHEIKGQKYGYIQNQLYENWYEALTSMVRALIEDANRVHHTTKRGERLLHYVEHYKEILMHVPSMMVNYDLWPSNILCKRTNEGVKYSWIDPERSFYGDPIADFVCFEFLVPLKKKKKTVEAYNEVASIPLRLTKEEEIRYALMEGYLALIMEVEKYYRYTRTNPGWTRNVLVSGLLYRSAFSILK